MSQTLVQAFAGKTTFAAPPLNISATGVTSGNGLIALVNSVYATNISLSGAGGTWTQHHVSTDAGHRLYVLSNPNPNSGSYTIAISSTDNPVYLSAIILEINGQPASGWFDISVGQLQATASPTSGVLPSDTSQADELLVCVYGNGGGGNTLTNPTAGTTNTTPDYTFSSPASLRTLLDGSTNPADSMPMVAEYINVTNTDNFEGRWTNLNVNGLCVLAAFKAAVSSVVPQVMSHRRMQGMS